MLSGIGPGSLILILIIVLLLFGTKKLRNIGSDLGAAIKNFREASNKPDDEDKNKKPKAIDGESREEKDD